MIYNKYKEKRIRIYRISAIQKEISFKQNIKADSYQDAKNKFYNEINKIDDGFLKFPPDIEIENVYRNQ